MGTKVNKHLISTWNGKGGGWRLTRKTEGVTGPGYNLRGGLGCESEGGGWGLEHGSEGGVLTPELREEGWGLDPWI